MKLQLGKRYRTACGFITGTLVVNYSQGTHGFLDPYSLRQYNEIGEESGGNPIDTIVSVYYTWSNDSTPLIIADKEKSVYSEELINKLIDIKSRVETFEFDVNQCSHINEHVDEIIESLKTKL